MPDPWNPLKRCYRDVATTALLKIKCRPSLSILALFLYERVGEDAKP